MNLNFPSSNQLKYAQNVFPASLPPHVINQILIEADDYTFKKLCSSPEFASFCSSNSAFSEHIYEERARKKYAANLIQFKPREMKWREFDRRMNEFINYTQRANTLAEEGKLMELKILHATTGETPDVYGANEAVINGHLDILKWIHEHNTTILPNIDGVNEAAEYGHLDVLKWIYENAHILPDIDGVNSAVANGHIDVLKWIYETSSLLPDVYGADLAAYNGYINILKWIYEKSSLNYTPTLPDSDGADLAARYNHKDVVEWLASKGVFPN